MSLTEVSLLMYLITRKCTCVSYEEVQYWTEMELNSNAFLVRAGYVDGPFVTKNLPNMSCKHFQFFVFL